VGTVLDTGAIRLEKERYNHNMSSVMGLAEFHVTAEGGGRAAVFQWRHGSGRQQRRRRGVEVSGGGVVNHDDVQAGAYGNWKYGGGFRPAKRWK
jgi:hypothetical protein